MHWSSDAVDYLQGAWRTDSASEIARHLGASRSSVLGKARRLHLAKSDAPSPVGFLRLQWRFGPVLPSLPALEIDLPPVTATTCPVPFLEVEGCRWPLAGDLFCNAERVEGRPYCAGHIARAYVAVSPIRAHDA